MFRAYKMRIFPTEEQKLLIAKTFGCCRWYWNQALHDNIEYYKEYGKGKITTPHDRDVNAAKNILQEGKRLLAASTCRDRQFMLSDKLSQPKNEIVRLNRVASSDLLGQSG